MFASGMYERKDPDNRAQELGRNLSYQEVPSIKSYKIKFLKNYYFARKGL